MNEITENIKQKIYGLYDECLSSTEQFHRKLDLFIVPTELADKILDETNRNIGFALITME